MAHLSLDGEGRMVLEAQFSNPSVARSLRGPLLAFVVVERLDNAVVFDRIENTVEAIGYLKSAAEQANLELTLGTELEATMSSYGAEKARLEEVLRGGVSPRPVLPVPSFRSELELLPHQVRGVQRALQVGNFAEFSVQGAGKTMAVLATFAHWRANGEVDRLLVIGPVSSFQPWEDEIRRCFDDELVVLRWTGSAAARTRMVPAYRRSNVVLCSYDTARRDVPMLAEQLRVSPTALVLDESHYIKNFEIGARGAAMLELAPYAEKRLILSGTPAPHSLLDLYPQFAFLWPGAKDELIGTPQEYLTRLSRSPKPSEELRRTLGPFFHRTSQSELGLPEPATHGEVIPITSLPPGQARVISLLENKLAVEAKNLPSNMDRELLSQWRKARIVRLLQAASNPALLSTTQDMPRDSRVTFDFSELAPVIAEFRDGTVRSAKIEWAVEKSRALIASGRKVLIWTWWISNIHLLAELLREFNPYNCGQFLQSLNRIHRIGLPESTTTEYWIPVVDCGYS